MYTIFPSKGIELMAQTIPYIFVTNFVRSKFYHWIDEFKQSSEKPDRTKTKFEICTGRKLHCIPKGLHDLLEIIYKTVQNYY